MEQNNSIQNKGYIVGTDEQLTIDEAVKEFRRVGFDVSVEADGDYKVLAESSTQEIWLTEVDDRWTVIVASYPWSRSDVNLSDGGLDQSEAVGIAISSLEAGDGL